jgi:uncharacterized phage infection (PIP) family protein YhgE
VNPDPAELNKLRHTLDTVLGRLEATNEELARLRADSQTGTQNRTFLETRANELKAQNEQLQAQLREAQQAMELANVARGFQSETVDPDHFAEIARGLQPQFQKLNSHIERLQNALDESNRRIATMDDEVEKKVKKARMDVTDKLLLREAPDFATLMRRDDFQDFLAEKVPGTRRSRLQELQDAYQDGDTVFVADLVRDFKLRSGGPKAVDSGLQQPPRAPHEQRPNAPEAPREITEDDLAAAHQRVLRNEATTESYRKLSAAYKAQQARTSAAS